MGSDVLLIDVAPLSLGIETAGGVMTILEGERTMTKDNNKIGNFQLSGFTPAPRGIPQIEVIFNIDANGILNVSATEKSKNITKNVTITNDSNRLSKSQIDDMLNKAEKFKEEDEKIKLKIQSKNNLENLAFRYKSSIQEDSIKQKLEKSDIDIVENKCNEIIKWLDNKCKELDNVCQKILAKSYGKNGCQTDQNNNF